MHKSSKITFVNSIFTLYLNVVLITTWLAFFIHKVGSTNLDLKFPTICNIYLSTSPSHCLLPLAFPLPRNDEASSAQIRWKKNRSRSKTFV
jgi:hypothetical protein